MHACLVTQSCPTLCDSMDCSPLGSSVHGILQARLLAWVAISFSKDLLSQGLNPGLLHCRQILYRLSPGKSRKDFILFPNFLSCSFTFSVILISLIQISFIDRQFCYFFPSIYLIFWALSACCFLSIYSFLVTILLLFFHATITFSI